MKPDPWRAEATTARRPYVAPTVCRVAVRTRRTLLTPWYGDPWNMGSWDNGTSACTVHKHDYLEGNCGIT
jgi:hypothetical protein